MQRPTTAKSFNFDLKLLPTACIALLSAEVPALVGTLPLGLHAPAAIAKTQSAEAIAKIAQAITVRIEGATQGSGVLVKREGNRYTVLTAWHVVNGQRPGEELDIYTSDGQRHQVEQGRYKRLGEVDLAVLNFMSSNAYEIAPVGDVKSVSSGSHIYISGFPLPTSAVPTRLFRFLKGDVIANATVAIPNGYQLLYSNPTLPGMSGGAAINNQGQLIGIHASAERADQLSDSSGKEVATGTNQAVPISYYNKYLSGAAVVAATTHATTVDDYFAQAKALLEKKGNEQEVIRLTGLVLATQQSAEAYFLRANAKYALGDNPGAIADHSHAIAINPKDDNAYNNRGNAKSALGDKQGAIADYSQAIAINSHYEESYKHYNNRGAARSALGDNQGAIADYNQAIAIHPQFAMAYGNRGDAKSGLGDKQGAIADYSQAIAINPKDYKNYNNRGVDKSALGDKQGAIADYNQAIAINPQLADAYINRGNAKSALGDKQGAIADYNQAIAINPKDYKAYNNRGAAKHALGDKQGAIADYSQAITISPEFALAYSNRGEAKSDLGDKQGACSDYKIAISLGHQATAPWLQSNNGAWCRL